MKKLKVLSVIAAAALMFTAMSCNSDEKTVEEAKITGITVNADSATKLFFVGDDFSYENLIVKATYSDNSKKTVNTGFSVALSSNNLDENSKIKRSTSDSHRETAKATVTYEGLSASYDVTISDVVSKIEISVDDETVKTSYNVGDDLDTTGVSVKAFYSDDDTTGEDITQYVTISAGFTSDASIALTDFNTAVAGTYTLEFTASYNGKTAESNSVDITVSETSQSGESDDPVDTGSESALSTYVYHKSIISTMADTWSSGTGVTVEDGKASLVSGNLWGAGGVCGVSTVNLGEIADYTYIVFTLDTSNYTISEAQEDLSSNTGVNVKIPEVIARPTKWFTKDGKTTYYIATSEFSTVSSTATTIALIIGGEGTLVVEDFYLAATEEPAEKEVEYKNTTVYTSGTELTRVGWYGTWSYEIVDGNIVSTGAANGCYGISGFTPIPFKEGAKLEVTYKSTKDWAIKPVAPEVETALTASDDFTTVEVSLGAASNLTTVGIVHKADDSTITISSIKVVDNE